MSGASGARGKPSAATDVGHAMPSASYARFMSAPCVEGCGAGAGPAAPCGAPAAPTPTPPGPAPPCVPPPAK